MKLALGAALFCLLLVLSALFSSSETAFMSLSALKVRQLLKEKAKNADLIHKLKEKRGKLLTTILVGNNLVNNFASSLAAAAAISLFGESGVGIATAVVTALVLIFGETVPKTLASYRPAESAQKLAPFVRASELALSPLVLFFSLVSRFVESVSARLFRESLPLVTEEELKTLIDLGDMEGTLESGEKELMQKIFEFTDLHVRDIMTKRVFIKGVEISSGYAQTVQVFRESGFSRLPVFRGGLDGICGIIHYKDVLFAECKGADFSLERIMHEPCFVPESKAADDLLQTLIEQRQNMAVAVDENGCNSGVVTMDDVLGAVFGRLSDEYDKLAVPPENRIEFINGTELRIPGDMRLEDINNILGFNLESEFYQTLGGWMLEQFGFLPSVGDLLRTDKATFVVEQQNQRRIQKVRVQYV